jgi:hypothetical protein
LATGAWQAAFRCFLSRQRIRAKADIVMTGYGDGMATTETGPEVHRVQIQNGFEHSYIPMFSAQLDKHISTIVKISFIFNVHIFDSVPGVMHYELRFKSEAFSILM